MYLYANTRTIGVNTFPFLHNMFLTNVNREYYITTQRIKFSNIFTSKKKPIRKPYNLNRIKKDFGIIKFSIYP